MNNPNKNRQQLLFEELRHNIAIKHSVPSHMTEEELELILNLFKMVEDRV